MKKNSFDSPLLYIISDKKVNSHLINKKTKIGRGGFLQKVDIKLDKKYVESIQGLFDYDENGWSYTDLGGSTNSMVNGDILGANNSVYLSHGDHILIGGNNLEEDEDFIFIVFSTNIENEFTAWKIKDRQEIEEDSILKFTKIGYHLDTDILYAVRFPTYAMYLNKKSSSDMGLNDEDDNKVLDINIIKRTVKIGSKKRDLLKDIKLSVKSGEMVLILGGSGAGKSTFLNAVSAYEKADASISFNNRDLYQDFDILRRIARLVQQYNTLRPDDIVKNTLEDIVNLQIASSKNKKDEVNKKVQSALQTFGLSAEAKNQVSKLSGGQQKRLSIAVEYISDPMIFYLDEPDSGLDASSAKEVMKNLRAIADEGKIVILISHSPDRVLHFFDKVLVLAKDSVENCGRLAYYGSIEDAFGFFDVESLEDIVKLINSKEEGGYGKADYYIKKYENINNGGK